MSGDVNLYRDADGNVIGPDVWIDGKPHTGTPLSRDALLDENQRYEKALQLLAKLNDPAGRIARDVLAGDTE